MTLSPSPRSAYADEQSASSLIGSSVCPAGYVALARVV